MGTECYTCGGRINYLMTPKGGSKTEYDACIRVAKVEFPSECGLCNPYVPPPPPPAPNNSTLVWSDEFSSNDNAVEGVKQLPDPEKWGYDIGVGGDWGWGNGELQYYTDRVDNAFVLDGALHIRAVKEDYEGKEFTSARLVSKNKGDFKYGRIQFRARLKDCTAKGTWPALWMLPTDWIYGGWPDSGEIDVMEHVGYDAGHFHGSIHTKAFNHQIGTQSSGSMFASVEDWHVYEIIWDEDKIEFIVDGAIYHEFSKEDESSEKWPFDQKFHLIMNVAVGGTWGGKEGVDANAFEGNGQIMEIDWVRVYDESLTISPTKSSSPPSKQPSSVPSDSSPSPSGQPSYMPSDSPSSNPATVVPTEVQFFLPPPSVLCLEATDNSVKISTCDEFHLNQVWIIHQNGEIRNKGTGTCLKAHRKKTWLRLSACPSDTDRFSAKNVFVCNEFHKTIVAAVSKKYGVITHSGDIENYMQAGNIGARQWIYKRV